MATTGQTINDRINAARYALAGQGLARCVCKATTEEVIGPKKKHIEYLIACTNEPNVSIPQLANLLIERSHHTSWVVVFKSLITVHQLMSNGNEKFSQYMASSNYTFDLSAFLDRTVARGYNMSQFVRKYSQYINAKSLAYRTLAMDLCRIGKEVNSPNLLRVMNMENLSKTLPVLENQLDALLNFDCTTKDLTNPVINAAFILSFRDLVKLFVSYNDCIINLLERYFKLSKKKTREAFGLYKNFLERMDRISEFLSVAEAIGVDKGEIPDLKRAPNSILDALESHLKSLQPKKHGKRDTPHSPHSEPEEGKNQEDESNEATPTNKPGQNPFGNPFLSQPKQDHTTSDKSKDEKIEPPKTDTIDQEERPKQTKGGFADTFGQDDTDKKDEQSDSNHITEPHPNGKHAPPPRPASSPAASPKHKAAASATPNVSASKETKLASKNEPGASKPPSRPPSRPPPPSSASSSRAVSPTIAVDVASEMADRQKKKQEEEKSCNGIVQDKKTSSKTSLNTDEAPVRTEGDTQNIARQGESASINEGASNEISTEPSHIRRDSEVSHTGAGHAPPARPAPPSSRKHSEAKIDPPAAP